MSRREGPPSPPGFERVTVLTEYFHPDSLGGTGTILSYLFRHLKDAHPALGIAVICGKHFLRGDAGELASSEDWDGIRILRVGGARSKRDGTLARLVGGTAFTLRALGRALATPRADLIVVVTVPPVLPFAACMLRWLRGTPFVYVIHDLFPDIAVCLGAARPEGRVAKLGAAMQRLFLRQAARVVVLGRCMKDRVVERYGVDPARVDVVTNWVDIDPDALPERAEARFRQRHEIDGFLVSYAGHIGAYQRFDAILDAAEALRDAAPDIVFCIVGGGDRETALRSEVARRSLGNVRVLPYVPREEYGDLLAASDVCLLSLEEGMRGLGVPSKLYNLLAVGRPIVAIVEPGTEVDRVLEELDCGFRIGHGEGERLAVILRELRDDPRKAREMGARGRSGSERYTLPKVADRLVDVFARAVEGVAPLGRAPSGRYGLVKAVVDRALAAALLLCFWPALLLVGLAIRLDSRGAAIYRQERVGRGGRPFTILKYRTMHVDAPNLSTEEMQRRGSIPVTRVGRLLRRASFDELPQLWNILRGEMSFVGPRPALPSQTDVNELRERSGVHELLPGLTGLAQVRGRDAITVEEKVGYDTEYRRSLCLARDVAIAVETFAAVLTGRGNR